MSGLAAALAVFDDAVLEALTNKGLVRRAAKDVESGKVSLVTSGETEVVVSADGDTVTIDAKGPKAARCTCPATGVCRHRLAAVMILRAAASASLVAPAPSATTSAPQSESTVPPSDHAPSPALSEMLAIDLAKLARWSGKAALLAAGELLEAAPSPEIRNEGQVLVVRLADGEPEVRILPGQGLDGMISKASPARRKALHAAIVLALRRANGSPWTEAAPHGAPKPAARSDEQIEPRDPAFYAVVRRILEDGVRTALNQAPLALEDRLFELSVSSRAGRLPRLSSVLRDISTQLGERRMRAPTHRPTQLLSRLAFAYAMNEALAAGGDGDSIAALAGEVRQDYEPIAALTLDGLGAEVWATRTGARGTTGYFYAHEIQRIVSVSLARAGAADPGFDPETAFCRDLVWSTAPLAALVRSRVTLSAAQLSPQGRLSLAGSTSATVTPAPPPGEAARTWPVTFSDWAALERWLQTRYAVRLRGAPAVDPILLAPQAHATATFDELAQEHIWPVADAQGRWLGLVMPHTESDEMAAARMTRLSSIADVCLALATPRLDGERLILVPICVVAATPSEPRLKSYDLRLAATGLERPSRDMRAAFIAGLYKRRHGAIPLDTTFVHGAPTTVTRATLVVLADELVAIAELGGQSLDEIRRQKLQGLGERLGQLGLAELGQATTDMAVAGPLSCGAYLALVHLVDRAMARTRQLPWLLPTSQSTP
jgi:hypothetical protein